MKPKPMLALVRGCAVCDVARREMLVLPSGEALCRHCASRLGALVRKADSAWIAASWSTRHAPPLPRCEAPSTRAERAREPEAATETELLAKFKEDVAKTLRPEDLAAHYDLAAAYSEMGLACDALQAVATCLDETASHEWAQDVLTWMFDRRHARPDAFDRIVSALRGS